MTSAIAGRGGIDRSIVIPFIIFTAIWGSTWIVIRDQLGVVPAQWSVTYRFALAAVAMAVVARWKGQSLRLDRGGLVAAAIIGLFVGMALAWNPIRIGLLSMGISVCAQAGDLLESAVKRRFGVKDASALIPGHGGVMDRLDGIIGGVWFFAICDALGVGVIGT